MVITHFINAECSAFLCPRLLGPGQGHERSIANGPRGCSSHACLISGIATFVSLPPSSPPPTPHQFVCLASCKTSKNTAYDVLLHPPPSKQGAADVQSQANVWLVEFASSEVRRPFKSRCVDFTTHRRHASPANTRTRTWCSVVTCGQGSPGSACVPLFTTAVHRMLNRLRVRTSRESETKRGHKGLYARQGASRARPVPVIHSRMPHFLLRLINLSRSACLSLVPHERCLASMPALPVSPVRMVSEQ